MKQRENYKVIILEPAKSRLVRGECPSCGKPKSKWIRRKDWRCCSKECTPKYYSKVVYYNWPELRLKALTRDKFTCVKCGKKEKSWNLVGDHIIPIALGGDEWDIKNVQTLCIDCNKIKTKLDQQKIAEVRRKEKAVI